ncbi:MAG: malonate decarboxylase holo-[acyl-carrier-protein] synthase [Gammaproteobacteria bacterium]
MSSHSSPAERPRRHDLVFIKPQSWLATLASRDDLAADPLVALWVDRGWPLIGRRAMPGELNGVPLGLPLPPFAGKRRLSFLMQPGDFLSTRSPPVLRATTQVAPRAWWHTLERLDELATRHSLELRVCGSLAWRALTGLNYVTEQSDLDLLLYVNRDTDLHRVTAELAAIEATAPMRLDGELIRLDGAAVNWREFHSGASEVLVKTVCAVALLEPQLFLEGGMPS